jgi:hypothetical protein
MRRGAVFFLIIGLFFFTCKKKTKSSDSENPAIENDFALTQITIDNLSNPVLYHITFQPTIKIIFTEAVKNESVVNGIILKSGNYKVNLNAVYQNDSKEIILIPTPALLPLTKYTLTINSQLLSSQNKSIATEKTLCFITAIDSSNKFTLLSDQDLLDKVQQQTFKYFWDFGHPVSGMARERNSSGDLVTTGGTGFGVMAIVSAVSRNFITRSQGATRILKISNFLLNNCTSYHGAVAHWINGVSGATIPFSANDNGGDLVETSLLLQGLISARQYFSTLDPIETDLRNKINTLYDRVEWNWYRQNNQNVLYWHWSPDKGWAMNQKVSGWNEALIVYVLAASAPSAANRIPTIVYTNGWSRNGSMKNNAFFYGLKLPLGPNLGGPLFLSQYSFLGINPNGLTDAYADYQLHTSNHTKINYEYCKANPKAWNGYSSSCWGITACDIPNGYNANEPGNNDIGVIAPTAALSAMPFTPVESMNALRFFYYKLGDKLWGTYGFYDAFKLSDPWFANSTLAIDQGPIIVMIENHRSGLFWNLFTSAPEIKTGMLALGFIAPYL